MSKHVSTHHPCVNPDQLRKRKRSAVGRLIVIVILFWVTELIAKQGWRCLPLFSHSLHTAMAVCTVHLFFEACQASRMGAVRAWRWFQARIRVDIGWRVRLGEI